MLTDNSTPIDVSVRPGPTGFNYLGWVYGGHISAKVDGVDTSRLSDCLHVAAMISIRFSILRVQINSLNVKLQLYNSVSRCCLLNSGCR